MDDFHFSAVGIALLALAIVFIALDWKSSKENPIDPNLKLKDIKQLPRSDWNGCGMVVAFAVLLLVIYMLGK